MFASIWQFIPPLHSEWRTILAPLYYLTAHILSFRKKKRYEKTCNIKPTGTNSRFFGMCTGHTSNSLYRTCTTSMYLCYRYIFHFILHTQYIYKCMYFPTALLFIKEQLQRILLKSAGTNFNTKFVVPVFVYYVPKKNQWNWMNIAQTKRWSSLRVESF